MTQPIGYYYSSRTYPLPLSVEAWIESLPMDKKLSLATAMLNQCNSVMQAIPQMSIARPTITNEDTND